MAKRITNRTIKGMTLIVVDASEKRRAEERLYSSLCKTLNKQTENFRRYEELDKPAFTTWMEEEFFDTLKESREIYTLIDVLQKRVTLIKSYAEAYQITRHKAYKIVMEADANGTLDKIWDEDELVDDYYDQFKDSDKSNWYTGENNGPFLQVDEKQTSSDPHLKSLYRQLVRKLHPDIKTNCDKEDQKLWHEVQQAYAYGDILQLEKLLKIVTGNQSKGADFNSLPIGDIMEFRLNLEAKLRSLKQKLRVAQKDPSWNFLKVCTDKNRLKTLKEKFSFQIKLNIYDLIDAKDELEMQLEKWKTPSTNKGRQKAFYDRYQDELF